MENINVQSKLIEAKKLCYKLSDSVARYVHLAFVSQIEFSELIKTKPLYFILKQCALEGMNAAKAIPGSGRDKEIALAVAYINDDIADSKGLIASNSTNQKLGLKHVRNAQYPGMAENTALANEIRNFLTLIEPVDDNLIDCYWSQKFLSNPNKANNTSLTQVLMIQKSLFNAKLLEKAYSFGQECLIHHAKLYETRFYEALASQKKQLLNLI